MQGKNILHSLYACGRFVGTHCLPKSWHCGASLCMGASMFLSDMFALFAALSIAILGRSLFGGAFSISFYYEYIFLLVLFPIMYAWRGLYPGALLAEHEELKQLSISTSFVFGLFITLTFLYKNSDEFSRLIFAMAWFFSLFFVPIARLCVRRFASRQSWWGIPVVLYGAQESTDALAEKFLQNKKYGISVRAKVYAGTGEDAQNALAVYASQCPQPMLLCLPSQEEYFSTALLRCEEQFHTILVLPPNALEALNIQVRDAGGLVFLQMRTKLLDPVRQGAKRILDCLAVICALPLLLPVFALIACAIRLDSAGPALYRQQRLGYGGKSFAIYKFRSMVQNADAALESYLAQNPEAALEWKATQKLQNDPRITKLGQFLRKTSLDELPQLINVLRGEMSLVGPRPIVQNEIEKYAEAYELYKRVRPGISGLWQVSGRSNTSYAYRVELDTYYCRNWSLWMDIDVLVRTVWVVLKKDGAC